MVMFYLDLVIVEFIGLIWEGCEIKMMKVLIVINVFVFVLLLFLLVKVCLFILLNFLVVKIFYFWFFIVVLEK